MESNEVPVEAPAPRPAAASAAVIGPAAGAAGTSPASWPQLLHSLEITALAAVSSFLGAVAAIPGAAFDAKHLTAAGIAAATAAAYRLSAVIQQFTGGTTNGQ